MHTAFFGPDERSVISCAILVGGEGETRHGTMIVYCSGSVPSRTSEVPNVRGDAVFPEHSVSGAELSYRLIANTPDADHLAPVIDLRGTGSRVAGKRRQFLDLAVPRAPNDSPELQDLSPTGARRIVDGVLSPADYLAAAIGGRGVTIIAAQSGKRGHCSVPP